MSKKSLSNGRTESDFYLLEINMIVMIKMILTITSIKLANKDKKNKL